MFACPRKVRGVLSPGLEVIFGVNRSVQRRDGLALHSTPTGQAAKIPWSFRFCAARLPEGQRPAREAGLGATQPGPASGHVQEGGE